ncbi:terminase large subunit domain-containing protein [Asticcacaulis taihuensis]|uniref:terminase large subunit domain-containing protein n=1 Tax=Asticcacaulis taihuensis TaxID=260084 RepID=UPI0026F03804|nr:terminase family protein [Asticcacaulis taihuensis]
MSAITHPDLPFDPERKARALYWMGWKVTAIAEEIGEKRTTVQSWKDRGKWDKTPPHEQAEAVTAMRYNTLVLKENKSGSDYKEIDLLGRQLERQARIRRYEAPDGHEGDLNPKVANRNAGPKKKARKNMIAAEAAIKLIDAFGTGLFAYQQTWMNSTAFSTRAIIKSRQIGATYYFAREALIRALETGNNQIFISASRAQANIFRQYIVDFVFRETGIQLQGDPLYIDRGDDDDGKPMAPVTLYFLGTNYRTAQGYHGDVYIDEYFWIHGFEDIDKVASAMASQKFYRVTYFSTPSTIAHPAYQLWSGNAFNEGRSKAERVKIDISHDALKNGVLGADGVWRHVVNIYDALAGGCDLFDMVKLQNKYSVEAFDNLFGCNFVDDSKSSFPFALVRSAMVDSWEVWRDYDPYALRPYAGEVWIGYDPNKGNDGDPAGLIALAAPKGPKGKFRVLEKHKLNGMDFEEQAAEIKKLKAKYTVTEIAIDTQGVGEAVYQLVKKFHPTVRSVAYSPMVKGLMVHKAQNVLRNKRLEFDSMHTDLAGALMSIHPEVTAGGKFVTYVSRRSAETGHGDIGWALLNALYCEPLDATDGVTKKSSVGIQSDDDD